MVTTHIKTLLRVVLRKLGLTKDPDLSRRYPQYQFGRGTYGDMTVRGWNSGKTLRVGAFTSVAQGVTVFLGGEHRPDWVTTYPFNVFRPTAKHHTGHPKSKGDVIIGSDVWIGTEAFILSGVTIGDGAVIGARAVVTRNVPPYAIVAGNPATVVRHRFDQQQIESLLQIRWWEWPDHHIDRAMPDLLNNDIDRFIAAATAGQYA